MDTQKIKTFKLSPSGRYSYVNEKAKDSISGEVIYRSFILDNKSQKEIVNFWHGYSNADWSLDDKTIYLLNAQNSSVTQLEYWKTGEFDYFSTLVNPSIVEMRSTRENNLDFGQKPITESLLSNLGYVPGMEIFFGVRNTLSLNSGKVFNNLKSGPENIFVNSKKENITIANKTEDSSYFTYDWILDPNGEPVLAAQYSYEREKLIVRKSGTNSIFPHKIFEREMENFEFIKNYFKIHTTFKHKDIPESKNKMWFTTNYNEGAGTLYEYDLENDKIKKIYSDDEFDQMKPIYSRRGVLLGVEIDRIKKEFKSLSAEGERLEQVIRKIKTKFNNPATIIQSISDDISTAIVELSEEGSSEVYKIELPSQTIILLSTYTEKIKYNTQIIHTKMTDGNHVLSYLSSPVNASVQSPIVVYLHGGPYERESYNLPEDAKLLIKKGYRVLRVNYRNSSGFNNKYINATLPNYNDKINDDIVNSLNNLIKLKRLVPVRTVLYGFSYGAYKVMDIATDAKYQNKFSEYIAINGLLDICNITQREQQQYIRYFANCKDVKIEQTRTKVVQNKKMIVAYGLNDSNVAPENSIKFIKNYGNNKTIDLPIISEGHLLSEKSYDLIISKMDSFN